MSEPSAAETQTLTKAYDHREVEGRWYPIWEKGGYFRAQDGGDRPAFSMAIPPPNITGSLHMGHALSYTIEDLVTRYWRMRGKNALWLPGTDHAGIATQMVVERELRKEGIDRRAIGREAFVQKVWEWRERCGGRIHEQFRAMGFSVDWSRERFTLDPGLSRAVRHVFVSLHKEGLIYRAQRLINWCPRCQTALSDLEVEHEPKAGKLWHIAYPVEGSGERLVVATTRPETLLGDTGVAVHPDDPRYQGLVGRRALVPLIHRSVPIVADPVLVSMEFGTGAVKLTPAHDFNDFEAGLRHGLERIAILDAEARTSAAAGPYAGLDRMAAREKVLVDLEAQGLLVKVEDHELSVGTCQRCATVVEPFLSWQWFVKTKPLAAPAIAAVENGDIRIVPESWKATYFHWMRNIQDWCISRQLWWGHQIPAWYCGCGEVVVAERDPDRCPRCGSDGLRRDPDVLDTWFSSALWPFSTLGWPDETAALGTFYPTTLMETGSDILFFWVARMIMMGLKFTGQVPFRDVYLHALVRDEHGEKMSKTKGNVIDPLEVTREHGADALRFTLAAQSGQGRDIRLSLERVAGYRAFCNKVWNASRFALMNLEDFAASSREGAAPPGGLPERWIRARLAETAREVALAIEGYRFSDAASAIYQFIWHELCDWYIELAKAPLQGGDPAVRLAAQRTLVDVLDGALRLLHPFMPFMTEEIWQLLPRAPGDPASIMVAEVPTGGEAQNPAALGEMAIVIRAIEAIRRVRGESNLPPGKRIPARARVEKPAERAILKAASGIVQAMAQLSEFQALEPSRERAARVAVAVEEGLTVEVPLEGLIDFDAEAARLRKELERSKEELGRLVARAEAPGFKDRAPEEVRTKLHGNIVAVQDRLARLERQLEVIAPSTSSATPLPPPVAAPHGRGPAREGAGRAPRPPAKRGGKPKVGPKGREETGRAPRPPAKRGRKPKVESTRRGKSARATLPRAKRGGEAGREGSPRSKKKPAPKKPPKKRR
ncbi:MAG: valine--tRNA ligase [Deltaproteobacteria bacterium]